MKRGRIAAVIGGAVRALRAPAPSRRAGAAPARACSAAAAPPADAPLPLSPLTAISGIDGRCVEDDSHAWAQCLRRATGVAERMA
jgi:hypothetical protein